MSVIKHDTKKLEVRFQTLLAPPPYSHEYLLRLDFSFAEPTVFFQVSYTGRDQLTEEEILEEGFTLQDDFEWKGTLSKTWETATLNLLMKTKTFFEHPKPSSQTVLSLVVDHQDNDSTSGIPDNMQDWEYHVQEVIQAIFEISKKELPLRITYVEQDQKSKLSISIHPRFSDRSLKVVREKDGKTDEHSLPWEQLMSLLQAVYLPDYDPEKAKQKLPDNPGNYIDQGDGLWYALGKAVTNPSKKIDAIGQLEKKLKDYF